MGLWIVLSWVRLCEQPTLVVLCCSRASVTPGFTNGAARSNLLVLLGTPIDFFASDKRERLSLQRRETRLSLPHLSDPLGLINNGATGTSHTLLRRR